MPPQIRENLLGVIKLVRGRNKLHRSISMPQVLQVLLLAFEPGEFRLGIGTFRYNPRHPHSEFHPYIAKTRLASLVLHRIVEQRSDRVIFVSAVSENNRGYAE
jgi:hypothetical protein